MTKADRARLIRQRFKANGGVPFVFTGVRKPKPQAQEKPAKIYLQWPQANRDTARGRVEA